MEPTYARMCGGAAGGGRWLPLCRFRTLPQVLCQIELVANWGQTQATCVRRTGTSRRSEETNHVVLGGAEFLHASRVQGCRCCASVVLIVRGCTSRLRRNGSELETALRRRA